MRVPGLALVVALAACDGGGDDDSIDAGSDASARADAGNDASTAADAAPDAAPADSCNEQATPGRTFAVDPGGPDTQIYSAVAADEGGLWIAYCRPELAGTGLFDVAVTRLACDGTPLVEPVVVSGIGNDIAVAMARSADRFLVAWLRDNGQALGNLDIVLRALDDEGGPIGEEEHVLETTRDGAAVTGNHRDPAVAMTPDGGFWLAGSRVDDRFDQQVFVQRLDPDGQPTGEARDVLLEPGVRQATPALAVGADGRVWLAYVRAPPEEPSEVVFGEVADAAPPPAPVFVDLEVSDTPALAVDPDDPGRVLLAATGATRVRQDILVVEPTLPEADRVVLELGEARDAEHTPAIVMLPGGVAVVAYHRVLQGIQNAAVLQALDGLQPGPASVVSDDPTGPYPYGLAALEGGDGLVAVTFSDGTSPDFVLRGEVAGPAAP